MQFSANLSMLFTEHDFQSRFSKAAACGFSAVEFWFPYHYGGKALLPAIRTAGVHVALFNLDPGDVEGGEWGTLSVPGRTDHFRKSFDQAVELAQRVSCGRLNALAGVVPNGQNPDRYLDQLRENLSWAAKQLPEDIVIVLEALNPWDKPGYLISNPEAALDLVKEVNQPGIGFLLDIYHAGRFGSDIVRLLVENDRLIKHIQIADVPGRHQPGTGCIQFDPIFQAIRDIQYPGYIGLEYQPLGPTEESLTWREALKV